MKKVLIIGSGGREHALAWKLLSDQNVQKVYCAPGNGGTEKIAENIDSLEDESICNASLQDALVTQRILDNQESAKKLGVLLQKYITV